MTAITSDHASVTVIIPTLNEEQNIDPLLQQLTQVSIADCQLNILFVDDQSTDQTVAKINQWHQRYAHISVLERRGVADLTQSILDGVKHCSSEIIAVMDADLSHPIDKLAELLRPIITGSHDVSVGSRYVKHGGVAEWPLHRRLISWLGGLPARVLTDIKDTTSGFFACRRACFDAIDKQACGYKILLEILSAGLDKFTVKEVPIVFTDRTLGQSKLSSKQMVQYVKRLLEICGGQVSTATGSKFIAVGLSGVVVDALFFTMFLSQGWTLSQAHIVSFMIAALSNYLLNSIWSFKFQHQSVSSWLTKALKFIYIASIALILRGGVIALLTMLFNMPPTLAIYPAIITAAVVNYLGVSFLVFPHHTAPHASINWRVLALGISAFILVLRLLYLGTTELLPDEAYYWNYTQFMAWGYLDHPPLVAWIIAAGTSVFGDNEFGVRIVTYCMALASLFFMFRLTRLLFDQTSAYISLLLLSIYPFSVVTGMLATTDGLQVLFWTAGLYFLADGIIRERISSWLALGVCVGLGMLSKYTTALFALSLVFYMLINSKAYYWWKRPVIYLSAGLAVLVFLPNLLWNAQHEWSSFLFQTARRLQADSMFSSHYLLLHATVLLSPVGLILSALALTRSKALIKQAQPQASRRQHVYLLILVFTLLPLSVFIYFSLNHPPRFHWTAPIWLSLIPLSAYLLSPTSGRAADKAGLKKFVIYGGALLCLIYGGILHYSAIGLPLKVESSLTSHYFWQHSAAKINQLEQQIMAQSGQRPVIICLSKWSIASALRFYDSDGYVDNILSRNAIGETATMYETWTQPSDWHDRPVLFVAMHEKDINSPKLSKYTRGLSAPERHSLTINNRHLRTLLVRQADSYQPAESN